MRHPAGPEIKQQHSQGRDSSEQGVHQVARRTRTPVGGHHGRNRAGVKGLVQDNYQGSAQSYQKPAPKARFLDHGSRYGKPADERMHRHTHRCSDPRKTAVVSLRHGRPMVFVLFGLSLAGFRAMCRRMAGQIVVVIRKEPLQEEHAEKTAQGPLHRAGQRTGFLGRARNKMQQGHPEHQAGDKTEGHLQPGMIQPHGQ